MQVGDLKSNPSLCSLAQKWADHLAATGTLQHSSNDFQGERLGENVAMKWGSGEYTGELHSVQSSIDRSLSLCSKSQTCCTQYHSNDILIFRVVVFYDNSKP